MWTIIGVVVCMLYPWQWKLRFPVLYFLFSCTMFNYILNHCERQRGQLLVTIKLQCIFFVLMQRFSCIIGPNGSGKSNVIDSMLFVFGYRAQKIRSKKISVLIHNSDEHSDIQSCTVEVHFQKIIDKVCFLNLKKLITCPMNF